MTLGTARVIRGNALDLPLADATVDLVVTSPPYFGLRSYQDGGEHYAGQIGAEPTPAEFVDALIAATREMVRVLKPTGSIWVNLGDKYAGSDGGGGYSAKSTLAGFTNSNTKGRQMQDVPRTRVRSDVRAKSLMGIPWRYALRCIDDLGLILRAEIIWSKPNGLPESVTDRVRRSHEQWFHLVKQPRYYSAVDEIRETHDAANAAREARDPRSGRSVDNPRRNLARKDGNQPTAGLNPLGKLPGSVWTIPTQPLQVPPELGIDHFAAFPMEWPRRIIQGWSPAGVCSVCGQGRRPVTERAKPVDLGPRIADRAGQRQGVGPSGNGLNVQPTRVTGYACDCPEPTAPTIPATILDPFGGTGTTALVAKALGRTGISVDMSADYCRLATWRTTDPGQLAAALQVDKPEPVHPDQLDLFGEVVA